MAQAPYKYDPLPAFSTYTRIITLHPARRTRQDLYCTLHIIDLHDPGRPAYEAVSYTWDGQVPSSSHILQCQVEDGSFEALSLTSNSARALREMRLRDEPRNLWMDAVCIDQSHAGEKNHQVANMKRVYSLADRVLIWLPTPEGFTTKMELTMRFLREIAELDSQSSQCRRDLERIYRRMKKELGTADEMAQMWHLFGHAWFHRVWTLQEVALNASDALVHCGDTAISWQEIQQARSLSYILDPDAAGRRWQPVGVAMNGFELLRAEVRVMTRRNPRTGRVLSGPFTSQSYSLLEILRMARTRRAADPRDSVFGVFGICQALGIECPLPDYTMGVQDVFLEATKKIIEAERNPSVLMDVVAPGRDPSLPSWIPDWHSGWDPQCVTGQPTKSGFSRIKDLTFLIDKTRRALTLPGQVFRDVTWVGAKVPDCDWGVIFPDAAADTNSTRSPRTKWPKLPVELYRYPAAYSAIRDCLQVFPNVPLNCRGKTPISFGGLMSEFLRGDQKFPVQSDKNVMLWTYFCRALLSNSKVPMPGKPCPALVIEEIWRDVAAQVPGYPETGTCIDEVDMGKLYSSTLSSLSGQTFFAVSDGIMTVLGDVLVGDVVAELRGLNDYAVLRKTGADGEYRFVGIAFRGYVGPGLKPSGNNVPLTLV